MSHTDKMERFCQYYGVLWNVAALRRLLDLSPDELYKKWQEDYYLNNIPLKVWDGIALSMLHCPLSMSERVSMQKHAARKLLEELGYDV